MELSMPPRTDKTRVDAMIDVLRARVQDFLGNRLVAMYLDGSLTTGDFDQDSDIDFVVVTETPVTPEEFAGLQAMHEALARLDSPWAIQLEGSYLSRRAVRRFDPEDALYPNLERGPGERLKWAYHDETWDLHRYVLRERGIPLVGPAADTLIDPVPPDRLRAVMRSNLTGWAARFLEDPGPLRARGYQSYVVLSLCRILYTLETAQVVSKRVAASWAQVRLEERWSPLIARAIEGRRNPDGASMPEDVRETQAMIRAALERAGQAPSPAPDAPA
jgi:predicted nucleotidyltransferase